VAFPYTLATFIIPNGAAVSNAIFIADGELVGIFMDTVGWTAAAITFLTSVDGVAAYVPMYDGNGTPLQVGGTTDPLYNTYIAIGSEINVNWEHFRGSAYLQLQSSTKGSITPVNQGAARTLIGVIRKSTTGVF
jgi:hypothetical protein